MEEPLKKQQSSSTSAANSKLRYPLRSASKSKDQTNKSPGTANNSSSKRGRNSNMSKSVSVLELSGKDKDKAAKPPRRLSIPSKSAASPLQKSVCNVTPISEARSKRSINGQERCDTPLSDVSRSSTRRKFNILASASYWLSQVKLSESAAKHSISLGFFRLALEAGSEPKQRLREELKSYVQRHNLADLGEAVRSLFESYEISESFEQLQESVTCSHAPEDATALSGDEVQSTSSTAATRKLKPKPLKADTEASSAKASSKRENTEKVAAASKLRASGYRNTVKPKSVTESGDKNIKKSIQKAGKQESKNGEKLKNQDEKPVSVEVAVNPATEETMEGNKENMDAPHLGEVGLVEAN